MPTYRELLNGIDNALKSRESRENWSAAKSARMWGCRDQVQDVLIQSSVLDRVPNCADQDIARLMRRVGGRS